MGTTNQTLILMVLLQAVLVRLVGWEDLAQAPLPLSLGILIRDPSCVFDDNTTAFVFLRNHTPDSLVGRTDKYPTRAAP